MNPTFDSAAVKVIDYLVENNYSASTVSTHRGCFRRFKRFLSEKNMEFSSKLASQWLDSLSEKLCRTTFRVYVQALQRLSYVVSGVEIPNTKSKYIQLQAAAQLNSYFKQLLQTYETWLSQSYSTRTVTRYRNGASRFLFYLQNKGIENVEEITLKTLSDYFIQSEHRTKESHHRYFNDVRRLLKFLLITKDIPEELTLIENVQTLSNLIFLDDEVKSAQSNALAFETYSPEQFLIAGKIIYERLLEENYSKSVLNASRHTNFEMYLFMKSNNLVFSSKTTSIWLELKQKIDTGWKCRRRFLNLALTYLRTNTINTKVSFRDNVSVFHSLPSWFKSVAIQFLESFPVQEYSNSTKIMYRSSLIRFSNFLSENGVGNLNELTPKLIKHFHLQDLHATPEGKNAYSSKIRLFLQYLADTGVVRPGLPQALSSQKSARTDLIDVLNKSEVATIEAYRKSATTPKELKYIATVLLSLRVGLRSSDICNLQYENINWKEQTVSFVQMKTGKPLVLPIPKEVSNALVNFLLLGRPNSDSPYIFISLRAPFTNSGRSTCRTAIRNILGPLHGNFHILRKTFATNLLKSNVQKTQIAELLGHTTNETVMMYLSTDDVRMRKCGISLASIEIIGGLKI